MLWKCCTQYASTFGKLSSGHRTGKCQFSFQSQRKAMPKNVQTVAQLHSSHPIAKKFIHFQLKDNCFIVAHNSSKFSKRGFNSMWTENFQMFKLVLEKAEEPENKLPTSAGSSKKQESSKKVKVKLKSLNHVWLFETPRTVAYQASTSMGFSRQEYWSGLPFPSPGYLLNPGIKPGSHALQADTLPSEPPREFQKNIYFCFIDYVKVFDCVDYNKLWQILRDRNTRPHDLHLT